MRSGLRLTLARGVFALHVVSMLYLVVAWSLPWTAALWTALVVYPLVQIQWWSLDNRCFLTLVEERLRAGPGTSPPTRRDEEMHFVSSLLSRALGRPVSRFWGDALSYSVIWGGFAITALRLYARCA